mgnify:CR=1 FL=1
MIQKIRGTPQGFSIGFGKPILNWRGKDNTEYVIAAIPLGGYVRMADERDGDIAAADLPQAFNRQSVGKRSAIAAAGRRTFASSAWRT